MLYTTTIPSPENNEKEFEENGQVKESGYSIVKVFGKFIENLPLHKLDKLSVLIILTLIVLLIAYRMVLDACEHDLLNQWEMKVISILIIGTIIYVVLILSNLLIFKYKNKS